MPKRQVPGQHRPEFNRSAILTGRFWFTGGAERLEQFGNRGGSELRY